MEMEIAKALILAGRWTERASWLPAPAGSAMLFPIANRPILLHNLATLSASGVSEVLILSDGDLDTSIRRAVQHGGNWGLDVHFADWPSPGCLGEALVHARDFIGEENVLVQYGDTLLLEHVTSHISTFVSAGLDELVLHLPGYGAAAAGASPLGYLLGSEAVFALARASRAADPVMAVQARGGRVRAQYVDGCRPCDGDVQTLLDSNRRKLEGLVAAVDPMSTEDCTIQGAVEIDPTAQVRRSLLRGPIVIGAHAQISDAYIGPYTAVGDDVVIEATEIEHSIVLSGARLSFVGTRLESSVIGRGARVGRAFHLPGGVRMSIGDGAEVVFTNPT